jgi:hypothetical protein
MENMYGKNMGRPWKNYGNIYIWKKIRTCGKTMENNMEKLSENMGNYGT